MGQKSVILLTADHEYYCRVSEYMSRHHEDIVMRQASSVGGLEYILLSSAVNAVIADMEIGGQSAFSPEIPIAYIAQNRAVTEHNGRPVFGKFSSGEALYNFIAGVCGEPTKCAEITAFGGEYGENGVQYLLKPNEKLSVFYEKMLCGNDISGVAKFSLRQTEQGCVLDFSAGGYKPLSQLKTVPLSRRFVFTVLIRIAEIIEGARAFMLEESSFILEHECIFVDTATLDVRIVYDPTLRRHDYSFRNFAKQWALRGNFNLSEDGMYPTMIIMRMNEAKNGVDIPKLRESLTELRDSEPKPAAVPANQPATAPAQQNTAVPANQPSITPAQQNAAAPIQPPLSPTPWNAGLVDRDGRFYPVNVDKFQIGKGKATATPNNLIVNNPSVSRAHALIEKENGEYYIKDLYSLNGTFINGRKIESNTKEKLNNGDILTFADEKYKFRIG